jgi:5'-3' exonuclease
MALPRVYLIDSSIYIFRAWHIYDASLCDKEGQPVNAVYGFGEFLWQLIQQKQPSLMACAFDASQTESYRRELYPEYKANREPAPPELKRQFSLCRDFCRAVGIADFGSNRYEADDIIGSLARHFRDQGYAITIVSADKDLTQLVTGEEDAWWDFARGNVLNHRGIEKQWGVKPHQIADLLAISGDKVDNIPGVPGVGYKVASRLLKKFPCVDTLLDNLGEVSSMKFRGAPRVSMLMHEHRELLPLYKKLTTVVTDIEYHDADITPQGLNKDDFTTLSEQLGFNEHIQRRWHTLPYNTV